jgi:hypothetical protein
VDNLIDFIIKRLAANHFVQGIALCAFGKRNPAIININVAAVRTAENSRFGGSEIMVPPLAVQSAQQHQKNELQGQGN